MVSLDQFKQTFLTECAELLVEMESRLVDLTPENADSEKLNAIFRCAHSIKGGAGAFGLDYITQFTHVLEALLDAMREGKLAPSHEAVDALLKSVDVVTRMVAVAERNEAPEPNLGADVLVILQGFVGGSKAPAEATCSKAKAAKAASQATWNITFAAHESLFNSGNEPLLILRELARLGSAEVTLVKDRVPQLDQLDPTQCYMSWQIKLVTDKPEAELREVFEFVDGHCDLSMVQVLEFIGTVPNESSASNVAAAEKNAAAQGAAKTNAGTSIRVDLDKVDRLVNMIGELVITEAMIKAQVRDFPLHTKAGVLSSRFAMMERE